MKKTYYFKTNPNLTVSRMTRKEWQDRGRNQWEVYRIDYSTEPPTPIDAVVWIAALRELGLKTIIIQGRIYSQDQGTGFYELVFG